MRDRIYVQIPAYRDRELVPTVQDMLRTAADPDRLRIAIAWQCGADEPDVEEALAACGNVEVFRIPAVASRGVNWARSRLQSGWNGEEFTLLVDSHHRFVERWDEQVIAIFNERRRAGVAKPIVTAYLPPYDPHTDPRGRSLCLFRICLCERHRNLAFRLVGHAIPRSHELTAPVPAHFASLHFLFARGEFNRDVPFDPSIYFFADEVAIALRAFTRGYDLFHPHCILGWHLYDRATRVTHWSDHPEWEQQQERSCDRLRELYNGRLTGKYGIGEARTVAEYESFIGLPLIGAGG
jgi:Glycosyltransferase (GlcNAc)